MIKAYVDPRESDRRPGFDGIRISFDGAVCWILDLGICIWGYNEVPRVVIGCAFECNKQTKLASYKTTVGLGGDKGFSAPL